ncbi:hypothetical protein OG874_37770 [Nocardia sp. NBC_00565]|uniref:hypothetical protein n=1 Tax=Nocardia sp. NBC_00565 TaxID=2975993 RepID=UPI002E8213C8|nr:hypothetical protein [Nocardia sp. NBC_00565]WUC02412.1 hypothetical protein OG874_37770 [Nocardia sp. NBC_00565]
MATGVGLRIAEDNCTAAIVTDSGEPQFIVRESILHMSDDGDTVLGGPAPAGHTHSITGFAAAVGDPAGLTVDDGEAYRAEDLVATALFCLINLTAEHLNGAAEFYAAYPAGWPSEYVLSLRDALDYLGLRSVLLVSEGDLPGSDAVAPELSYAYDAARAALAAVLATPAGATPPDPTDAENSTVVTDIIPAVPAPDVQPQAYSAALPVAAPLIAATAVEVAEPKPPAAPAKPGRTTPLLIGVAVVIGLVLGGFGVAVLFRDTGATAVPPVRDAKSDQVSVSPTPPQPPVDLPTESSTTTEPPIVITSSEPETTTEAPPTTTPPTTESTTTTPPTTTRPSRTTTTRPGIPMWTVPGWTQQPWQQPYTFQFPPPG